MGLYHRVDGRHRADEPFRRPGKCRFTATRYVRVSCDYFARRLSIPIRATLVALILAFCWFLLVPVVGQTNGISSKQIFVTVLMVLAAGIAAQMSGALYGIAEWALESYRKEREPKSNYLIASRRFSAAFYGKRPWPNNCKRQIKNSKLPVLPPSKPRTSAANFLPI